MNCFAQMRNGKCIAKKKKEKKRKKNEKKIDRMNECMNE